MHSVLVINLVGPGAPPMTYMGFRAFEQSMSCDLLVCSSVDKVMIPET